MVPFAQAFVAEAKDELTKMQVLQEEDEDRADPVSLFRGGRGQEEKVWACDEYN